MPVTGAGKSTLSHNITAYLPNFKRLCIDAIIHETHGLYALDYPADKYAEYQDEARVILKAELVRLLQERKRDIILDLSFWNREYRDSFKQLIDANDGRWVLIFLEADKSLLWSRITQRREQRDKLERDDAQRTGDTAYDVDVQTFEMFCNGFERPSGEGEIVLKVT